MQPRKVRRAAPLVLEELTQIADDTGMESEMPVSEEVETPPDWRKGALLNVRNYGAEYVITLHGEELDERHPERAIRFTNPARCQDWVSAWYAQQYVDPRAR
jgi:hypothetical protein